MKKIFKCDGCGREFDVYEFCQDHEKACMRNGDGGLKDKLKEFEDRISDLEGEVRSLKTLIQYIQSPAPQPMPPQWPQYPPGTPDPGRRVPFGPPPITCEGQSGPTMERNGGATC